MISFHNSGPLLILVLAPRMLCSARLARSSYSWTLSSRMCLSNCVFNKWGSLSWAKQNKKYNTGRACQPIKPGCAGSLNKCPFYGSITAPNAHAAMYAGVVKVMHFSYPNYPLLYSKEESSFLYLPEEQNNDSEL